MARGKCAAQAANRRAALAEARVAELELTLQTERAAWNAERGALMAEAQELRSRLGREVRALADVAIAEAKAAASEEMTAMRSRNHDQVLLGLKVLDEEMPGGIAMPEDAWPKVAAAFGIQLSDWLTYRTKDSKRHNRRMTNRKFRTRTRIRREVQAQGKQAPPEMRAWAAQHGGGDEEAS